MRINRNRLVVNAYSFFEYMTLFTLILQCSSVWTTMRDGKQIFNIVMIIVLAVNVLMCVALTKTSFGTVAFFAKGLILAFFYFFLFYVCSSYTQTKTLKYVQLILQLFLCYCFYCFCCRGGGISRALCRYRNLVCIIAFISLFFWLMVSVFSILSTNQVMYTLFGSTDTYTRCIYGYNNLYFETQTINFFGNIIYRNSAIFNEAPMYAVHLILAFLTELFISKKKSKYKTAILVLAIVSTISTIGIIIAIIALYSYFILLTKRKNAHKSSKLLFFIFTFLMLLVVIISVVMMFTYKLSTSSGERRLADIEAGFWAWRQNLLIGNGYMNDEALSQFLPSQYYVEGTSNSLAKILNYGGLYFILPYVISFSKAIHNCVKTKTDWIFFVCGVLMLFLFVVIPFQNILFFLLIWFADIKSAKHRTVSIKSNTEMKCKLNSQINQI